MTEVYETAPGQIPAVHVYDVTSDVSVFEHNADVVSSYPASCVKLMTLALARAAKSDVWGTELVTITSDDVSAPFGLNLSNAGLLAGDIMTWQDLAYAMVLTSGFDAAQAMARVLGTEAYVAAGSTGTTGMTRFVEMMNACASDLGMTNTTFTDAVGVSRTGDTDHNLMSARDMTVMAKNAWVGDTVAKATCSATTRNLTITGPNARTQSVANVIPLLNGPEYNPLGVSDDLIKSAKSGIWIWNDIHMYNMVTFVDLANAYIIITTIGSISTPNSILDQRSLILALLINSPDYFGD